VSASARQALGGVYPAALRRVTTLLGGGVSLGLVWPEADRPMVGRFLSPLGYEAPATVTAIQRMLIMEPRACELL
jgi:hypothetical protein